MSKVILLRVFDRFTVRGLYTDGPLTIEELLAIQDWCVARIADHKAMSPKDSSINQK